MANGPMGGFMPTPAAPAQPPSVKLDTTAISRGNFNTFLKNMNGATSLNPPSMAPSVGAQAPLLAPTMSDIDIFNPPMQMMQQGGNVAPRQTEIMGQPHMLAYITPQESDILEGLGGANEPGPMGIPSFFVDDFGDFSSVGDDAPSVGGDDGGGFSDDSQSTDSGGESIVGDDPVADIDFNVVTTPTVTEEERQQNIDEAQSFIDAANAQAAAQAQKQAILNQQIKDAAFASQAKQSQLDRANIMSESTPLMGDMNIPDVTTTTQPNLSSAMTSKGGTTGANVSAAAGTDFSNIGTKGLEDDPLGLSLEGVGLGPAISTPTVASRGAPSGPGYSPDDITGIGGKGKDGRDVSDFSTDIDALANVEEQAKKGSFPNLDKVPGTLGFVTGLINAATKKGAQNTIRDISRGFTPTYDKDGNITGTTNYGIGMGQPSNDTDMTGGFFSSGRPVKGYGVFDDTSPSIGMYDDNQEIGGDESDNPLLLKRLPTPEEEKPSTNIGIMGGANPFAPTQMPVVVDSPFTTNVGDFQGTGFSTGDLNRLIQQITGIQSPTSMAKGGVAGFANGGLIKAVDDFLATGT